MTEGANQVDEEVARRMRAQLGDDDNKQRGRAGTDEAIGEIDLRRVVDGGPWSFDNHLLVLHELQPREDPFEVPLDFVSFLDTDYDLPPGFTSEVVGKALGDYIRRFMEYDEKYDSSFDRSFMCIKVSVDVRQPLKKFKKVKKPDKFCEKIFLLPESEIVREWDASLPTPNRKTSALGGKQWLQEDANGFDSGSARASNTKLTEAGTSKKSPSSGASLGGQLLDCNLHDMPMQGHPCTWVRFKGKPNCVEERLDRALVNDGWLSLFPHARLRNLVTPISDHSPILLNFVVNDSIPAPRFFRFENKWMSEPTLTEEAHWQQQAKKYWLLDRDLNTKFFHAVANGRKKRKRIVRLQDDSGHWVKDEVGLAILVKDYFEALFAPVLSSNSHFHIPGDWHRLWQLNVPPKVKNFVWRAAREILPTRDRLRSRGVDVPMTCIFCSNALENSWNLFIDCTFAQSCWQHIGLADKVNGLTSTADSFMEWLFAAIGALQDPVVGKIVMIIWSIWRERNERFWKNIQRHTSSMVCHGLECLCEWLQVENQSDVPRAFQGSFGCSKWHPPPPSFVKCNCDAVVFHDIGKTSMGIVLRDEVGDLLAYKMLKLLGLPEVKECEALALLEPISWVCTLGYHQVTFETDSQLVFNALKHNLCHNTEFGVIIRSGDLLFCAEMHIIAKCKWGCVYNSKAVTVCTKSYSGF
ncbi:hypothetical protein PTKIN_Ptkin12aG0201100 [Pterospermum kingtungense]